MGLAPSDSNRPKPAPIAAWEALEPQWQNLSDPVFHWAEKTPDATAFIQGPEKVSYGELANLVGKAAVHLDQIGIRAGDRVAISLTNSIDHFILLLGLLRLGATTTEVVYNAERSPSPEFLAKFAVGHIFIEPVAAPVPGVPSIKIDAGWRGLIAQCQGDRRHDGDGDSMFTITLSSGTTGQVKGSLTTHRRYFQRMRAYTELFAEAYATEPPAIFVTTASIAFSTFFRHAISQSFVGGSVAILPRFLFPIDLVKAVAAWDDASCFITSDMCRTLIACAPQRGLLFPRLRLLIGGGGLLHAEEKLAILTRVSANFYEEYGASGFGTISGLAPWEMRERPASVGRAPSCVELQVVDDQGRSLPPRAVGRLRCRGTEGSGFAGDVDPAGDENYRQGWYYPGDLAVLDEAGYLFMKGRSADVVRRDGVELYLSEIESIIAQHPAVSEVAVVGVPRPGQREELVALIVPRGQPQHEAVAAHCKMRLPQDRWPDRVFYAQSLPKTGGSKLDRAKVKAIIMNEIERQRRTGAS